MHISAHTAGVNLSSIENSELKSKPRYQCSICKKKIQKINRHETIIHKRTNLCEKVINEHFVTNPKLCPACQEIYRVSEKRCVMDSEKYIRKAHDQGLLHIGQKSCLIGSENILNNRDNKQEILEKIESPITTLDLNDDDLVFELFPIKNFKL